MRVLKVDTPYGPCWKRYNHDGYGQRADGTSFKGWGVGHAWPLLMLERATYELACGRDIDVFLRAAEDFSTGVGLFPEQIWDAPDIPAEHMFFGKATGAAIPADVGACGICKIAAIGRGQEGFRLH